jgi:hypothetical protein
MTGDTDNVCEFCGKTPDSLARLIGMTPPTGSSHCICSECVGNCMKVLAISDPAHFSELVTVAKAIGAG